MDDGYGCPQCKMILMMSIPIAADVMEYLQEKGGHIPKLDRLFDIDTKQSSQQLEMLQ